MSNSSTQQGMKASMQSFLTSVTVLLSSLQGKVSLLRRPVQSCLVTSVPQPCKTVLLLSDEHPALVLLKVRISALQQGSREIVAFGKEKMDFHIFPGEANLHIFVFLSHLSHYPVKNKICLWMQRPPIAGNTDVTFEHPGAANWSLAGTEAQNTTSYFSASPTTDSQEQVVCLLHFHKPGRGV